jgi:hypothetical protein
MVPDLRGRRIPEVDTISWIAWPAFVLSIEHDLDDYSP